MINPNDPIQVAWLNSINSEIGNLVTSNHSMSVNLKFALEDNARLKAEVDGLKAQVADMGQSNAALRDRLAAASCSKKAKASLG